MDLFRDLLMRLGLSLADFVLFLTRLRDSPSWQGRLIDLTIRTGQSELTFPHGLGRANRGGFIAWTSDPVAVFVLPTLDKVNATVFLAAPAADDLDVRVWVF